MPISAVFICIFLEELRHMMLSCQATFVFSSSAYMILRAVELLQICCAQEQFCCKDKTNGYRSLQSDCNWQLRQEQFDDNICVWEQTQFSYQRRQCKASFARHRCSHYIRRTQCMVLHSSSKELLQTDCIDLFLMSFSIQT